MNLLLYKYSVILSIVIMSDVVKQKVTRWNALASAVERVTKDWTGDIELGGKPGTRDIHLSMASKVITLSLLNSDFRWPSSWLEEAAVTVAMGASRGVISDGINVMSLHAHNSSFTAGSKGVETHSDLSDILRHPRAFDPLARLTTQPSKVAGSVEVEHGISLTRSYDDFDLVLMGRYDIKDGLVTLPFFESEIYHQNVRVQRCAEGETPDISTQVRCQAHRADILKSIYDNLLDIVLKDDRLAVASLRRGLEFGKQQRS